MNTMFWTKVVGAFCGALLAFLVLNWIGNAIFFPGDGHGEEEHAVRGYIIETAEAGTGEEQAAEIDVAALVAEADPARGKKIFGKCKACHRIDGTNATGPHLDGVVGRPIASVEGYAYSDALKAHAGKAWTEEELFHFLEKPKAYAPGTKMTFAGLKKPEDRAALIAYLKTLR